MREHQHQQCMAVFFIVHVIVLLKSDARRLYTIEAFTVLYKIIFAFGARTTTIECIVLNNYYTAKIHEFVTETVSRL